MKVEFIKYSATGNDFIVFDNRDGAASKIIPKGALSLCDRRNGIGADGVVFFNESVDYDFSMKIFNADGSIAEMCGNAARALVSMACELLNKDNVEFSTLNGVYEGGRFEDEYYVQMTELYDVEKYELDEVTQTNKIYMNTGVPHIVVEVDDLENFDVFTIGKQYRNLSELEAGANVNFISKVDHESIFVRTYERGVEDETRSCGTGCVASAIAAQKFFGFEKLVRIKTQGGDIRIRFKNDKRYLVGGVKKSFTGEINIES
jgi:diaminopimelate epimerase